MDDKAFNIADLVAANPGVDPTKLLAGLAVLRQLREAGLRKQPGYTIASPFSRPLKEVPVTQVPIPEGGIKRHRIG